MALLEAPAASRARNRTTQGWALIPGRMDVTVAVLCRRRLSAHPRIRAQHGGLSAEAGPVPRAPADPRLLHPQRPLRPHGSPHTRGSACGPPVRTCPQHPRSARPPERDATPPWTCAWPRLPPPAGGGAAMGASARGFRKPLSAPARERGAPPWHRRLPTPPLHLQRALPAAPGVRAGSISGSPRAPGSATAGGRAPRLARHSPQQRGRTSRCPVAAALGIAAPRKRLRGSAPARPFARPASAVTRPGVHASAVHKPPRPARSADGTPHRHVLAVTPATDGSPACPATWGGARSPPAAQAGSPRQPDPALGPAPSRPRASAHPRPPHARDYLRRIRVPRPTRIRGSGSAAVPVHTPGSGEAPLLAMDASGRRMAHMDSPHLFRAGLSASPPLSGARAHRLALAPGPTCEAAFPRLPVSAERVMRVCADAGGRPRPSAWLPGPDPRGRRCSFDYALRACDCEVRIRLCAADSDTGARGTAWTRPDPPVRCPSPARARGSEATSIQDHSRRQRPFWRSSARPPRGCENRTPVRARAASGGGDRPARPSRQLSVRIPHRTSAEGGMGAGLRPAERRCAGGPCFLRAGHRMRLCGQGSCPDRPSSLRLPAPAAPHPPFHRASPFPRAARARTTPALRGRTPRLRKRVPNPGRRAQASCLPQPRGCPCQRRRGFHALGPQSSVTGGI